MDNVISKIVKCGNIATKTGSLLEYQFNAEYDLANDIWYRDDDDFKASEWQKTLDISTTDGTVSGSGRASVGIESFSESLENTIKQDYASSFLKALYLHQKAGDSHLHDLLDHGLNVRLTTYFGNGAFVRSTWQCCTITDMNTPFEQFTEDSDVTLTVQFNDEPIIENVGVGFSLPTSIQDVTASINAVVGTNDLSVTITDVTDVNDLVINPSGAEESWTVSLFNKKTGDLINSVNDSVTGTFAFADLEEGTYLIALSYCYMVQSVNNVPLFKYINTKEVTI